MKHDPDKYDRKSENIFSSSNIPDMQANSTLITNMRASAQNQDANKYDRDQSQNQGIRWGEVAMDAAHTPIDLAKSLYSGISNAKTTIPKLVENYNADQEQPIGRQLKNRLAGVGQFGDILNQAPANIRDYFKRKGASEDFGSWIGRPEKQNWQEAFGLGEEQPGDIFGQGVGKAISGALLSGGSSIPASIVGGLYEAGENRNPLVPGAGIGLTNTLLGAYQRMQGARGSHMAPQAYEGYQASRAQANANFTEFHNRANQAGVTQNFTAPNNLGHHGTGRNRISNQATIIENVPESYLGGFNNYVNNGQRFEDAIQTVSDLKGYVRFVDGLKGSATPAQNAARRAASGAIDRIDRSVNRALRNSSDPGLANYLQEIRADYLNNVVPWFESSEALNLWNRQTPEGRRWRSHEDLIGDLKNNKDFMNVLSHEYPGFATRRNAKRIGGAAALFGVGYPHAKGMYNALFGDE